MPAIETPPTTESPSVESTAPVRATRFDPPHEIPRADAAAAPLRDAPKSPATPIDLPFDEPATSDIALSSEAISPALVRQFRTQAQQLAGHLESRQRELDHRESELHTQLARHEASARSARLWFQEQHRKLTQRQSEWERREREIANRLHSASGPATVHSEYDAPGEPQASLTSIDDEIEFRLREADLHVQSAQLEARFHHSESTEKKLDRRRQHIDEAEARIARNEVELQFAQQEFHAEREAYAARIERERRQSADNLARQEAELAQRRTELDQQANQLEKRAAAIEQLRGDLLTIQRDTLEAQLAAEELRAELAGKAPPAMLIQSMARLRAKLADQYRLQSDGLERQRSDVVIRTEELAKQQVQIAARQRELEAWIKSQYRQIEDGAAQLASREQQLERQENDRASRRLQWEAERRELEIEIRQLQTHLRRLEENALELT